MVVQRFRLARPLLTVAMILLITAVTSCSSFDTTNATRAAAGGVSPTSGATPTAARVTALGQRDANSLSLRAKQYLNAAATQYLNPVPDTSGKPTWSVSYSRVASPESGQVPFGLFSAPRGGGNRLVASVCGTTWTTLMRAGFSTRSPFVTAELRGEESSDPVLQIGEWDIVAPPAAVQALTQVATTCGSRLRFGGTEELTSSAQSVQVLGSPAVAIQSMPNHRELLNSLFAFSGTRMLVVSSHGWADGAPDKPPLPNDVLTQLASALLRPSGTVSITDGA